MRVVPLIRFADLVRSRVAGIERLRTRRGNEFLTVVKSSPAIVSNRAAATDLLRTVETLPRRDRDFVLSRVPLGRGPIWVTNYREIIGKFATSESAAIELFVERLALPCPPSLEDVLLLCYDSASLSERNIRLHFPTCFDAGFEQGRFRPSSPRDGTGLTWPARGGLQGLPEAVHKKYCCSILNHCVFFRT